MTNKQILHEQAMKRLRSRLAIMRITYRTMPYPCPFDMMLANGLRCEVKAAELHFCKPTDRSPQWKFNLHRHGKITPQHVDVYALYCCMETGYGIWLIIPSKDMPKVKTLELGWRALARYWGQFEGRFDLLRLLIKEKLEEST